MNHLLETFSTALRDVLAPHGFRRQGRNYIRRGGSNDHILSVQLSDASTPDHMKVTVNIGAFNRLLGETLGGRLRLKPNSATACHLSTRIGRFEQPMTDRWWVVTDDASLTSAISDVQDILLGRVIPLLDSVTTNAGFLALLHRNLMTAIDDPDILLDAMEAAVGTVQDMH